MRMRRRSSNMIIRMDDERERMRIYNQEEKRNRFWEEAQHILCLSMNASVDKVIQSR